MEDIKSEPELENLFKESFQNKYYQFDKDLMNNPTFMELIMLKDLQPYFFTKTEREILDDVLKQDLIANVYIPEELYGMMYYDENTQLYTDIFSREPLVNIEFVNLVEEQNKKFITGILELDFDEPLNEKYVNDISEARKAIFKASSMAEDYADENYGESQISKDINHLDRFDSKISDVFHIANRVKTRYKNLIQYLKEKNMLQRQPSTGYKRKERPDSNVYTRSQSPLSEQVRKFLEERVNKSYGGKKKYFQKTSKKRTKNKKKRTKNRPTRKRK